MHRPTVLRTLSVLVCLAFMLQGCAPRASRYHLAKARVVTGQVKETQADSVRELEATENVIGQMETLVRAMAGTVNRTEAMSNDANARLATIPSGKGTYSRSRSRSTKKRR